MLTAVDGEAHAHGNASATANWGFVLVHGCVRVRVLLCSMRLLLLLAFVLMHCVVPLMGRPLMIVIVMPWAAACLASCFLFYLVVIAHKADIDTLFNHVVSFFRGKGASSCVA